MNNLWMKFRFEMEFDYRERELLREMSLSWVREDNKDDESYTNNLLNIFSQIHSSDFEILKLDKNSTFTFKSLISKSLRHYDEDKDSDEYQLAHDVFYSMADLQTAIDLSW